MMFKYIVVLCIMSICHMSYGGELFHRFHKTYMTKKDFSRTISVGLILVDLEKHNTLEPQEIIYNQVLSYSKDKPFGDDHGRSTNVHETVHGINNVLRNTYTKNLKKSVNGFYADNGKGIIVENPKITLRDIVPYIPEVLRGYRYNLYFVKQLGDWNEVPTYPMDEWSAYIAGAECAIDDSNRGIAIQKSDYVSGALEFSIYCTALALVTKHKQQDYWNNNLQFRNAIKFYLIKSEKVFAEGHDKFPSEKQDLLLDNLRNHNDAKQLRDFLIEEFEGIFVD